MTTAAEAIAETIPQPEEEPSPARIEAFSDAVFAIIITLLVLDVRVPRETTLESQSLGAALMRQWPLYVAYILSFLQVGVVWSNHHTMFHYIRRSDHVLLILNLLLLLCVAVLPFTTAILAEYARAGHAERQLAAMLYSAALRAAGLFFSATWQHALRAGLVSSHADPHRLQALRFHWMLVPLLYGSPSRLPGLIRASASQSTSSCCSTMRCRTIGRALDHAPRGTASRPEGDCRGTRGATS